MRAMFANLTRADFGGRWHREARAGKRWQVHALFDEIQVAISNDDFWRVDHLMAKLVSVTASHSRASHRLRDAVCGKAYASATNTKQVMPLSELAIR